MVQQHPDSCQHMVMRWKCTTSAVTSSVLTMQTAQGCSCGCGCCQVMLENAGTGQFRKNLYDLKHPDDTDSIKCTYTRAGPCRPVYDQQCTCKLRLVDTAWNWGVRKDWQPSNMHLQQLPGMAHAENDVLTCSDHLQIEPERTGYVVFLSCSGPAHMVLPSQPYQPHC